jgi:NifU-like protein involved in Fe-S cluster formation
MMTEAIIGRPLADVLASSAAFFELVAGPEGAPGRAAGPPRTTVEEGTLQPLRVFEQVRAFPSRQRCATLCWETLSKALAGT